MKALPVNYNYYQFMYYNEQRLQKGHHHLPSSNNHEHFQGLLLSKHEFPIVEASWIISFFEVLVIN